MMYEWTQSNPKSSHRLTSSQPHTQRPRPRCPRCSEEPLLEAALLLLVLSHKLLHPVLLGYVSVAALVQERLNGMSLRVGHVAARLLGHRHDLGAADGAGRAAHVELVALGAGGNELADARELLARHAREDEAEHADA